MRGGREGVLEDNDGSRRTRSRAKEQVSCRTCDVGSGVGVVLVKIEQ